MQHGYAQSIAAIKKRADASFEKKEYEAAKVDYRQLLAQNQKNLELNYKYATCIYYTEDIKNARKYYDFILAKKESVFPLETYYYIGKIYQHQYYFETAIQQFNVLIQKDPKLAAQLDVQSEIQACQFAMEGMKNMLTLNVLKKSQPYGEDFYNHYSFVDDAYSFYKASEVFPKENGKHHYEPVYAFKRGMKYRVFASYSAESPSLDLYVQRKNANNEWDKPLKVLGTVNTTADEIYPFYDAEYGYIYFSSKGHQSMGGFDLFRAKYDLESNVSSDVENLHFPYSSPNDDYFYIPDLVSGNANFASNRNGKLNAVETYLVSAAQTPKELLFITGILSDQIDQTNKSVKIEIIVPETNERFGPFVSQLNGSYLIGLPGPGSYEMEITVTGSNKLFKESLEIPILDPEYELQQELIYSMVDSKEQLKVLTRMKPKSMDNMALLSEKLNLASKMDVNLASFNRKVELSPQQKMQLEWGVTAKDTSSLIAILSDSLLAAEVQLENQVRLTNFLAQELKEKQATLQGQMSAFDQRMEKGSGSIDPVYNEKWLQESKDMEQQLDAQLKDIQFLQDWMTANQQRGIPNIQVLKSLEEINQQIALLQYQQNSEAIMDLLTEKKELIKGQLAVAGEDLAAVIRTYTQEQERMQAKERAQFTEQQKNQLALAQQIVDLKQQASAAKGKDRLALDTQIQEKERLNVQLKKELTDWSAQLDARAQNPNQTFAQRQTEVDEILLASEKMPLPSSAVPFDLAKEQEHQVALVQQRTVQQQQLKVQTEKVKTWSMLDPSYAADIAQINATTEDPIKRAQLLRERESKHLTQLKGLVATSSEGEQEWLQEQIQLAENRVKVQDEALLVAEREREQERERETERGTETTQVAGTNIVGTNTTAKGGTGTERGTGTTEVAGTNVVGANTTNQQGSETERTAGTELVTEVNQLIPESIVVSEVKESPHIKAMEEMMGQIDQVSTTSLSAQEKASMKEELESSLALEKRRAAITQSMEILGDRYPSIRTLQQSYEQEAMQINTLNVQALEQAILFEKNPEKIQLLKAQLASLKEMEFNDIHSVSTAIPIQNQKRISTLPISIEEPADLKVLQGQTSYVQYAKQRATYQENLVKIDSLHYVKSQLEDSMRLLLTEEKEISLRRLENLAAQHAGVIQNIEKGTAVLEEQQHQLMDFGDQASYEWMMRNGVQASSMMASTNATTVGGTTAPVPFGMTTVTTMNQRFPDHPINVALPNGLIFRVQVGAFRKPVPNQLFREFGPVSGEVLNNGLTCYLAGYFNGSMEAIQARTNIRRLGYADAFIVAYCDGKRMSFNEGKLMEANGTCRKQSSEELQLALNELLRTTSLPSVEAEVNRPPVASPDPNSTEANLDLYYTVQVAVYNKALTSDNIQGIGELLVTKTEKGQFRYSSGEFTSFADARQRKNEVVGKGIPDAYVVAYYRGKRISIGEANQLLAAGVKPKKRGEVPLPTETNLATQTQVPVEIPKLIPLVKRDSVVQYEFRVDETDYLAQLSRFNRVGTFTYQAAKNRIVSPKYLLDSLTVNQQLYLADMKRIKEKKGKEKAIQVEIASAQLNGDFYDWLLRQNISYDAHQKDEVWIFHFYPENELQTEQLKAVSTFVKWRFTNE